MSTVYDDQAPSAPPLAAEQTCVAEAEINPLIRIPDGVTAADFRIRVEPRTPTETEKVPS